MTDRIKNTIKPSTFVQAEAHTLQHAAAFNPKPQEMEQQLALLITLVGELRDMMAQALLPLQPFPGKLSSDRLLQDQEVETMLKISNSTLRRYRKEKRIPCTRIKGKYYYSLASIQQIMKER